MKAYIHYLFLFTLSISIISCRKHHCHDSDTKEYKLSRVDYNDLTGVPTGGYRNLFYTGDKITKMESISGNSQVLAYENGKLISLKNMLLGVPFPITALRFNYYPNNLLQEVITGSNGVFGQSEQVDTISFSWLGPKLLNATLRSVKQSGQIHYEEDIKFYYTSENITKVVFEGIYYGYTAGPVHWKDSVEFKYDTLQNRFSADGLSFFLEEFAFLSRYAVRIESNYYIRPQLDPVFLAFIYSSNNVTEMRSNGGRNTQRFSYIMSEGKLSGKLAEIRINDRAASKYSYMP